VPSDTVVCRVTGDSARMRVLNEAGEPLYHNGINIRINLVNSYMCTRTKTPSPTYTHTARMCVLNEAGEPLYYNGIYIQYICVYMCVNSYVYTCTCTVQIGSTCICAHT